jgi:hypothetical protein
MKDAFQPVSNGLIYTALAPDNLVHWRLKPGKRRTLKAPCRSRPKLTSRITAGLLALRETPVNRAEEIKNLSYKLIGMKIDNNKMI